MEPALALALFGVGIALSDETEDPLLTQIATLLPNVPASRRQLIADAATNAAMGESWSASDVITTLSLANVWFSFELAAFYLTQDATGNNCVFGDPVGSVFNWGTYGGYCCQSSNSSRGSAGDYWLHFDGTDDYLRFDYSGFIKAYALGWRGSVPTQSDDYIGLISHYITDPGSPLKVPFSDSDLAFLYVVPTSGHTVFGDPTTSLYSSAILNGIEVDLTPFNDYTLGCSLTLPEDEIDQTVLAQQPSNPGGQKYLTIGAEALAGARYLSGDIYFVRLFSTSLDSSQATQLDRFDEIYYSLVRS